MSDKEQVPAIFRKPYTLNAIQVEPKNHNLSSRYEGKWSSSSKSYDQEVPQVFVDPETSHVVDYVSDTCNLTEKLCSLDTVSEEHNCIHLLKLQSRSGNRQTLINRNFVSCLPDYVRRRRQAHEENLFSSMVVKYGFDISFRVKMALSKLLVYNDPVLLEVYDGKVNLAEDYYFLANRNWNIDDYSGVCLLRKRLYEGADLISEYLLQISSNCSCQEVEDLIIENELRMMLGWTEKSINDFGLVVHIDDSMICTTKYFHLSCPKALQEYWAREHSSYLEITNLTHCK